MRILRYIFYTLSVTMLSVVCAIVAIYSPPVQHWLVDRITGYVSGLTGMDVKVGRCSLLFPLDLTLDDVTVSMSGRDDTQVTVRRLRSRCAIRPLLEGKIEISSVEATGLNLRVADSTHGAVINARMEGLRLSDSRMLVSDKVLEVGTLRLKGADVAIRLAPFQAKEKPDKKPFPWKIRIRNAHLQVVDLGLKTPDETTLWQVKWKELTLDSTHIWPEQTTYEVSRVTLTDGCALHHSRQIPWMEGRWSLEADSLVLRGKEISTFVRTFSVTDDSATTMLRASGKVAVDSLAFRLSAMDIRTAHSHLFIDGYADKCIWTEETQGRLAVSVDGKVGSKDLLSMMHRTVPRAPISGWAGEDLHLEADVSGRVESRLTGHLTCRIGNQLHVEVHGRGNHLSDDVRRDAEAEMKMEGKNLEPLFRLFPLPENSGWTLPQEIEGNLRVGMHGVQCQADLVVKSLQGEQIVAHGNYNVVSREYALEAVVDSLALPDILQQDSTIRLSACVKANGREEKVEKLKMSCVSDNRYMKIAMEAEVDTLSRNDEAAIRMQTDICDADMHAMGISDGWMKTDFHAELSAVTNMQDGIRLEGRVTGIVLNTADGHFTPKDLSLYASALTDSFGLRIEAGDLKLMLASHEKVDGIVHQMSELVSRLQSSLSAGNIPDAASLKSQFPRLTFALQAKADNPLNDFLRYSSDCSFDWMEVGLDTSLPDDAWVTASVRAVRFGGMKADTVRLSVKAESVVGFTTTCQVQGLVWEGLGGGMKLGGDLMSEMMFASGKGLSGVEGEVMLHGFSMSWTPYALNLHLAETSTLKVTDGKLKAENLAVFAHGKSPMTLDGEIVCANWSHITTNLTLRAQRCELMDVRQQNKKSLVHGKVFVSLDAIMRGEITHPTVRGNLVILGGTDVTYKLEDSPLMATDKVENIVTFVNLADTVKTPREATRKFRPASGFTLMLDMKIETGASLQVDLGGDNYVRTVGGGRLDLQYTPQGEVSLVGRYTLVEGEMKYSFPVVASKTFRIVSGSYVEFMGNPQKPILRIKAIERVRASVTEGGTPRYVNFDVGVSLENTFPNVQLAFTLEAPEDLSLQNQLAAVTVEERTKLALAMLVSGIYIGGEDSAVRGGWKATDALGNFIQSVITDMAGSVLKNVDITIGAENNYTDAGVRRGPDYSFRFAKRFWNNRLSVVVGGRISQREGEDEASGNPFIDDISLEWRIGGSGNRLIRIFHVKTHENILEDEVVETGVGIVFRYTGGVKKHDGGVGRR